MHRVNLEDKNIRLDLICDSDSSIKSVLDNSDIKVVRTSVDSKTSKLINKEQGEYISIFFDDITDYSIRKKLISILVKELRSLFKNKHLIGKSVLIVGLGNSYSTADSLGPKVIDNIIVTRHLSLTIDMDEKYSVVSKIIPGVFANTGIESFDIIKSITKNINPDFISLSNDLS